ncbi:MAG: hypothetical protein AAGI11_12620 [Pseudomonadota bacterium]
MLALSLILTIAAGVLSHVGVRLMQGVQRVLVFLVALACLGLAFSITILPGGYWSGVYALLSLYILVCSLTPWIALLWRRNRAG